MLQWTIQICLYPPKEDLISFLVSIYFFCFLSHPSVLSKLSPDRGFNWLLIRTTTSSHRSSAASTTSRYVMGHLGSRLSLIASAGERTPAWWHRRDASCGSSSSVTRSWRGWVSASSTLSSQVRTRGGDRSEWMRGDVVLFLLHLSRSCFLSCICFVLIFGVFTCLAFHKCVAAEPASQGQTSAC